MSEKNTIFRMFSEEQKELFFFDEMNNISCFIAFLKWFKLHSSQLSFYENYLIFKPEGNSQFLPEIIIKLIGTIVGLPLTFFHSDLEKGWVFDLALLKSEVNVIDKLLLSQTERSVN